MKINTLHDLLSKIKDKKFEWPSEGVEISLKNEIITRREMSALVTCLTNKKDLVLKRRFNSEVQQSQEINFY